MATGGLVILIPHLSDGSRVQQIQGINQEWLDRLDRQGGALHPKKEDLGSTDAGSLNKWSAYFSCVVDGRIRQSAYVDPEMLTEAGIELALHCWGTRALLEDGRVSGVVFESKSGRLAVRGKVVVDCTGDGDIFASAGAEYELELGPQFRSSMMALVFRLGGTDYMTFARWPEQHRGRWQQVMKELEDLAGFRVLPLPSARNDVVWVNNWLSSVSCLDVNDLTRVETAVRRVAPNVAQYLRSRIPGFENCFIFDTACQVGTRGSRRLKGVPRLTMDDVENGRRYADVVAVFPSIFPEKVASLIQLPYGTLVPQRVDGLLVAGRCFSADIQANDMLNLIPHCAAMGEAAGCAAALALQSGCEVRSVDFESLQTALKKQGVYLPGE